VRSDPYTRLVLVYTLVPAPWGDVHLAVGADGLVAVQVFTPTDVFLGSVERLAHETPEKPGPSTPAAIRDGLDRAVEAIAATLDGRPSDLPSLPFDLRVGSAWDQRILEGVRTVPRGSVTSYGRVARIVGSPGAARAAGGAVGRNPLGLVIPCHRVIAGDGSIGGYGGDWWGSRERLLEIKRELLALEGVRLPATSFVG
jgi:methylated-DNA-[protein]-cysteine S-methyltransferase